MHNQQSCSHTEDDSLGVGEGEVDVGAEHDLGVDTNNYDQVEAEAEEEYANMSADVLSQTCCREGEVLKINQMIEMLLPSQQLPQDSRSW